MQKTENQLNAYEYEHQCIKYHDENFNMKSWHWKYIPEEILYECGFIINYNELRERRKEIFLKTNNYLNNHQEYGIDGIAIEENESGKIYHGIQSKLYKRLLSANDLGTFFAMICFRMRKKNINSCGYLYHSNGLNKYLTYDIQCSDGVIKPIKLKFNENLTSNQKNLINDSTKEEESNEDENENDYQLRDYQNEAIEKLNEEWDGIRILNLPCGTGKTIVCGNYLKNNNYKKIFIFSPLKFLVKQNLERFKHFLPNYSSFLLDSDEDGSLDFNVINENMNNDSNVIFSTTFKSAEEFLINMFEENEQDEDEEEDEEDEDENNEYNEDENEEDKYYCKYDLEESILIVDEAHNLLNKKELNKIIKSFPKVILMTATPPRQLEEELLCDTIYTYPFSKAIEEKYICDYQIYLPLIENNEDKSEVKYEKPTELNEEHFNNDLTKKILFLINGLLRTGSKNCIVYMSSVEEINEFTYLLNEVNNKYHYLDIWVDKIVSDIKQKEREKIINSFKEDKGDKNTIKILCSIRILDEGIDLPECDSIFIGDVGENSSDIRMIQRICRANRLIENRPLKIANCFLWTEDTNKIINSLQLLKENDIEFNKKIKMINMNYDKNGKNELKIEENEKNIKLNQFINVKCLTVEELWEYKKNLLFEFVEKNGRVPTKYEFSWYKNQKKKIKNEDAEIYKKLSINLIIKQNLIEYLIKKEENKKKIILSWEESKDLLFKFVKDNNKLPPTNFKEYVWYLNQKTLIKSVESNLYINLSVNNIIKNDLDKYLTKNKKKTWDESKELLFNYINENYNNKKIQLSKSEYFKWFEKQKIKIKSKESELYKKLSKNIILKK